MDKTWEPAALSLASRASERAAGAGAAQRAVSIGQQTAPRCKGRDSLKRGETRERERERKEFVTREGKKCAVENIALVV